MLKEVFECKTQLRKDILALSCKLLPCSLENLDFEDAEILLSYVSLPSEVDVWPVIEKAYEQGLVVAFPSLEPTEFVIAQSGSSFYRLSNGTLCPKGKLLSILSIVQSSIMLVPGLAFTTDGWRLGRGSGFYDRVLSRLPSGVKTIGICKKQLIRYTLPIEAHDRKVQKVICV